MRHLQMKEVVIVLLLCAAGSTLALDVDSVIVNSTSRNGSNVLSHPLKFADSINEDRAFSFGILNVIMNLPKDLNLNQLKPEWTEVTDLFKKFKDDKVKQNLFEREVFRDWVVNLNSKYENPEIANLAIIASLTECYSAQNLASMLISAKEAGIIDDTLLKAQMMYWLLYPKNADEVFTLLNLNNMGNTIFKCNEWKLWYLFVSTIDKRNGHRMIFTLLKSYYSESDLSKMLIQARKDRIIDYRLMEAQIESWMDSGKTSDDVFNLLKLNDMTENSWQSPLLGDWIACSSKRLSISLIFYKLFTNSKQRLPENRNIAYGQMFRDLMKSLLLGERSGDEVFKVFQLQDNLFNNLTWKLWVEYLTKIQSSHLMIPIMQSHYNNEQLLRNLREAFSVQKSKPIAEVLAPKIWEMCDMTPEQMYKFFALDKIDAEKMFQSDVFPIWLRYLSHVQSRENKDEDLISLLENIIGRYKLAVRFLYIDKVHDHQLQTFLKELRMKQFQKWMEEGIQVMDIYKWVEHEGGVKMLFVAGAYREVLRQLRKRTYTNIGGPETT